MIDRAPISRAARAWRGAGGALAATLLAAVSHGIAGGTLSWLAVTATALLALPICTVLAGRVGSLWRLSLAVSVSQFLYHWLFAWVGGGAAGLGIGAAGRSGADPMSPHLSHLGVSAGDSVGNSIGAQLASTGSLDPSSAMPLASTDTAMWASHALAALLTIALLHRGERAFLALVRLVRSALPLRRTTPPVLPRVPSATPSFRVAPLRNRLLAAVISHRGPPAPAAAVA